jgi:putative CocE/NonD family hydrolase
VLCYTSEPLAADLTVAGPLSCRLFLRSSGEQADFFVRLCDVRPFGRSVNVSDGVIRLRPGDIRRDAGGVFELRIRMWDTAIVFRRGHRLRLQVSSGLYPEYPRNPGCGDPLSATAAFRPAEHEVLHDPAHRSGLDLPVADLTTG